MKRLAITLAATAALLVPALAGELNPVEVSKGMAIMALYDKKCESIPSKSRKLVEITRILYPHELSTAEDELTNEMSKLELKSGASNATFYGLWCLLMKPEVDKLK